MYISIYLSIYTCLHSSEVWEHNQTFFTFSTDQINFDNNNHLNNNNSGGDALFRLSAVLLWKGVSGCSGAIVGRTKNTHMTFESSAH